MRPTMLGYLIVATTDDLDAGRRHLMAYATREGYTLGGVYTDLPGQESGFYAMFDELRRSDAAAVAVPHLSHLAHLPALAAADSRTASRYLHARLRVIEPC